ncbi:3TM-type holin [Azospirillum sp. HJ39]|uniref:3TM-type holin n=1 Tax=Azospirillum sp. HJ39 TaxID=3159496 RepID=UPI003558A961
MAVAIPLITALTPLVADLLGKIPDPEEKAKAAASANAQLVAMLQAGDTAQIGVNTAEASNPSLFVSGWRPAGARLSAGSAFSACWSRPSATRSWAGACRSGRPARRCPRSTRIR